MICKNRDTRLQKSWYRKPAKLPILKMVIRLDIKSHRKLQIRSPKIANAKTYTYPRIQLLPYVIRICILHISLRVYSLDSGADNSNYHLDKIVSNLQVLVIKAGKFTKTMSKWSSAKALRIFFCLFDLSILSKWSLFAIIGDSLYCYHYIGKSS